MDTCLLTHRPRRTLTAEMWLREIFERAPGGLRVPIVLGWRAFGADLGPNDRHHVLGWQLADSRPGIARITVTWRIGLDAAITAAVTPDTLTVTTITRTTTHPARLVWAGLVPIHQILLRILVELADRRPADKSEREERTEGADAHSGITCWTDRLRRHGR